MSFGKKNQGKILWSDYKKMANHTEKNKIKNQLVKVSFLIDPLYKKSTHP